MVAAKTPHLGLSKPALSDPADVDIINGNFDILDNALLTTGGTMTGNLSVGSAKLQTNGYIQGTWIQTTSASNLTTATQVAVLSGGWIYYMTLDQLKEKMGAVNVRTTWE